MTGEIALYGVLVPPLLIEAAAALAAGAVLRRALALVGFYRHVWHRALFDFAVFVILLGMFDALAAAWFGR
jgi:protein AaeX